MITTEHTSSDITQFDPSNRNPFEHLEQEELEWEKSQMAERMILNILSQMPNPKTLSQSDKEYIKQEIQAQFQKLKTPEQQVQHEIKLMKRLLAPELDYSDEWEDPFQVQSQLIENLVSAFTNLGDACVREVMLDKTKHEYSKRHLIQSTIRLAMVRLKDLHQKMEQDVDDALNKLKCLEE